MAVRLSHSLSGPPWVFGLLYFLLIPAFAALYARFPGEFFHATVQYEQYLKADETDILEALRAAMIDNYVRRTGKRTLPGDSGITWDNIGLFDLRPESTYAFSFAFGGDFSRRPTEAGPAALRFVLDLYWRRHASASADDMYPINLEESPRKSSLPRELFPFDQRFTEPHEFQLDTVGYVVLSDSFVDRLRAWGDAKRGFPSRISGSFSRMLYLSAITITTVGFGDILPISNRARIAVGAEAVIGVVMIGLFLNAIAAKVAMRR